MGSVRRFNSKFSPPTICSPLNAGKSLTPFFACIPTFDTAQLPPPRNPSSPCIGRRSLGLSLRLGDQLGEYLKTNVVLFAKQSMESWETPGVTSIARQAVVGSSQPLLHKGWT